MRWIRVALVTLATTLAGFSATFVAAETAQADEPVGLRSFHDHLAPYGTWMDHPRWGTVWRPNAGHGFRPYRDGGHWANSEAYGVVWVSDYAWGDIPFHYGRWAYDPAWGWVWVPGYVWAPAWVIWREGDGNVGWLPMPPWIDYDGYGVFPDDWNDWYGYGDYIPEDAFFSLWSFVAADDLFEPRISYYVIGPRFYSRFIRRTEGWTRFSILNGHLFNRSVDRDRFRSTFGHSLPASRRSDIESRLGPVMDYADGKRIEKTEQGAVRAGRPSIRGIEGASGRVTILREHSVNVIRGGAEPVRTHVQSVGASLRRTGSEPHSSTVNRAVPERHVLPAPHPAPAGPTRAPAHPPPPNTPRPH